MVLGIIVSVNKVTQDNIVRSDKKIWNYRVKNVFFYRFTRYVRIIPAKTKQHAK